MKRIFAFMLCLCVAGCVLASCGHKEDTNEDTTTSTSILTNTSTTTVNATTINVSTTTVNSTTTTTTDMDTTTTQKTDLPNGIAFYSEYPNVPDYGALIGVDHSMYKNDIFYYRMDLIAQADPDGNSGSLYMQLLQDCGYVAIAPYDKDGVQGYLYGNSTNGITVLFAAAREQGSIVVAISQQ